MVSLGLIYGFLGVHSGFHVGFLIRISYQDFLSGFLIRISYQDFFGFHLGSL
jgi:hypothetical protein